MRSIIIAMLMLSLAFAHNHQDTQDAQNHDTHDNHSAPADDSTPANRVGTDAFGFIIEPLILDPNSADGGISFYLEPQDDYDSFRCSVRAPSGEEVSSSSQDKQPCFISFEGQAVASGRYSIRISNAHHTIMSAVVVHHQQADDGMDIYSAFVPAPSLASRGKSDAFIYAIHEGKNVHDNMSINYLMEGMQHSTDDEHFVLEHQHLDDTFMTNRATLSFPMLGAWLTTVTVNEQQVQFVLNVGETAQPEASQQPEPAVMQDVQLDFRAMVGDEEVRCGQSYDGIGLSGETIEFKDFRFYVHDVQFINHADEAVSLELEQDTPWQYQNVALLDFANAEGECSDSAAMNHQVVGTLPAGHYHSVIFTLGVPENLNHEDAAVAASPLNITPMWWVWRTGYKFFRIDLENSQEENNVWPLHLGSTGCMSEEATEPPSMPCMHPNRVQVQLPFDITQDVVVADVASLLRLSDVSRSLELAPPGCMSGPEDPDCRGVFRQFGLDLQTGQCFNDDCSSQRFFSRASKH